MERMTSSGPKAILYSDSFLFQIRPREILSCQQKFKEIHLLYIRPDFIQDMHTAHTDGNDRVRFTREIIWLLTAPGYSYIRLGEQIRTNIPGSFRKLFFEIAAWIEYIHIWHLSECGTSVALFSNTIRNPFIRQNTSLALLFCNCYLV